MEEMIGWFFPFCTRQIEDHYDDFSRRNIEADLNEMDSMISRRLDLTIDEKIYSSHPFSHASIGIVSTRNPEILLFLNFYME